MTDLKMGGVNRSPLRLVDKLWPPGIGKDRFTVAAMKLSLIHICGEMNRSVSG